MTTKKYYREHKEEMIKKALQWEKDNPKRCKEVHKKWCQDHPEKIKTSVKKRQEKNRQYIQNYKLNRGCGVCGYNTCAAALDFHHSDCRKVGEKKFTIAHMVNGNWSLEKIEKEIEKCVILCANCHRELHDKDTPCQS